MIQHFANNCSLDLLVDFKTAQLSNMGFLSIFKSDKTAKIEGLKAALRTIRSVFKMRNSIWHGYDFKTHLNIIKKVANKKLLITDCV